MLSQRHDARHTISMTWRLRDHQEPYRCCRLISHLMARLRRNVDSLPTRQVHPAPVDLQLSLPVQNVEELLRFAVTMAYLGGLGRHLFFNNAETVVFDQMPAVAHLAPRVVLGVVNMNSMESAHNLPLSNDARLSTTGAQGSPQGDRIDLR